jgi:tetratricopeptide (TPR) repeat protein
MGTPSRLITGARYPNTVDSVMAQMASGDLAGAMKRINAALKAQPTHPAWLMCAGACARERHTWEQAEEFFERLAVQTPSVFEVWYQLALVRCEQHKTTTAINALMQALALQPQHAHCHYLMGGVFKQLGQAQQAQSAYLKALRCQADHPQASADLGLLWQEQGRFEAAETSYSLAVSLSPRNPVLAYNHALVLQQLQRLDEAEASYRRALALRPDFEEAWSNLGALLVSMGRAKEAEQLLQALIQSHPRQPSAHINLGNVWQDQGRLKDAEAAFRQALQLDPEAATARFNLGNLLVRTGRPQEAELEFRRAMRQAPVGDPLMAWNLSLLLLSLGRYDEAWPLHEARYADNWPASHVRTTQPPQLLYPAWQGESLVGRRIVVVQEQGGGDQIQFVRYLPLLLARGPAHVTLTCPEPLRPLFKQFESERVSVRTVSTLAELPGHDCWVLVMSLPLHLGTHSLARIPAAIPYLQPEPARVQAWQALLPTARQRVGLVWKGSAGHRNDHHRSLPSVSVLAPLWSVPDTAFVSLQKGQAEEEAQAPPAGQPLVHLGSLVQNFADSAAILSQLDLLICVDTGTAHLAGALGMPCWVLLPNVGTDWRWLHGRDESPWYPSLRLFRQGAQEGWAEVIERVRVALTDFVATRK